MSRPADGGGGGPQAPTVTALVPTYNGAAFVTQTLASLAAQDYPRLSILVSDDASTDETLAICRQFGDGDPRFETIGQRKRLGWVENSNWLISAARSEVVFFAPHDDRFEPSYVGRCVDALQADAEVVLAFSATANHLGDGDREVLAAEGLGVSSDPLQRALPYVLGTGRGRFIPFRGLVRTDRLRDAGGLRSTRFVGEIQADGRLLFRLALTGRFARVPEVLCHKRMMPNSVHMSWGRPLALDVFGGTLSYLPEIHATDLRPVERATLYKAVALRFGRQLRRRVTSLGRRARHGPE